ncbi:MAG: RNase H-like domain-containing protein, partial [Myxococcota bacterium]
MTSRNPVVTVKLDNARVYCLVDTGSAINILDIAEYEKNPTRMLSPHVMAVSVDGSKLESLGTTVKHVRVGHQTLAVPFLVVKGLQFPALLGIDFMQKFGSLHIDWTRQLCSFGPHSCPIVTETRNTPLAQPLEFPPEFVSSLSSPLSVLTKANVVPPRSYKLLPVTVCNTSATKGPILFEPSRRFENQHGIYIAASLHNKLHHPNAEMVIEVANPTSVEIPVPENAIIGTIHDPEDDTVPVAKRTKNQNRKSALPSASVKEVSLPSHLTANQRKIALNLLGKFDPLFSRGLFDVGHTKVVKHAIILEDPNVRPIQQQPFRTAQSEQKEVDKHVSSMLGTKIIRKSSSPWSASTFLVGKKDGGTRFIADFRGINAMTVNEAYPMPRVDDLLSHIGSPMYISALDQRWGFYQIEIDEKDIPKTGFSVYNGHYEFLRLPMGLSGSPKTFQKAMDLILQGLTWDRVLVYLDDTIILSPTFEEHVKDLEQVFQRLLDAGIKLRLDKCRLFQTELPYLGHLIGKHGIKPDPSKISKIVDLNPPKNKKEVMSFLGVTGYFRRFVFHYAEIAKPLVELTKKRSEFVWNDQCQKAFDTLMSKLVSAPILRAPNYTLPFYLATDASNYALGGVLLQTDSAGHLHSIAYASKTLNAAQRNYPQVEREALAVVQFLKHFRYIIYGHEIHVLTDHAPLVHILRGKSAANSSPRLLRWTLKFQDFNVKVHYIPGTQNRIADFLSRTPAKVSDIKLREQTVHAVDAVPNISPSDFGEHQKNDQRLGPLYRFLEDGSLPSELPEARKIRDHANSCALLGQILVEFDKENPNNMQILVPFSLVQCVLKEVHNGQGHYGIHLTYRKIFRKYKWINMMKDVIDFVKSCTVCQQAKFLPVATNPSLSSIVPPDTPFAMVGIDIWNAGIRSNRGNLYLLVITDYLSRYAIAVPMPKQDATTVAKAVVNELILVYGPPQHYFSDKGTVFLSQTMREIEQMFHS